MGTPQPYSEDTVKEICLRIMRGESLKAICRDDFMPPNWQVHEWLSGKPDFADRYARACEVRADTIFDDILEIADDNQQDIVLNADGTERLNTDHVQRAKLRIDARKWALAKMQPKKYGDKVDHNLTGNLTVNIATPDADL